MSTSSTNGSAGTVTIYMAPSPQQKEIDALLAQMEWRREHDKDYDWRFDDCHHCHGHQNAPVTVSAETEAGKKMGREYTLAPGQHDEWCPFARLIQVIRQQAGGNDPVEPSKEPR